jgi:hypothetical protein
MSPPTHFAWVAAWVAAVAIVISSCQTSTPASIPGADSLGLAVVAHPLVAAPPNGADNSYPYDVVWNQTDLNGLPLNPFWKAQAKLRTPDPCAADRTRFTSLEYDLSQAGGGVGSQGKPTQNNGVSEKRIEGLVRSARCRVQSSPEEAGFSRVPMEGCMGR